MMTGTTLLGDQIKLPRKEQQARLSKALVFGYIDSSKTEPSDFFQLANLGSDVLLMDSGVVLQNLAIRSTINKLAKRPLLLWMKSDQDTSMSYILDESLEAGISGADGIVFKSVELEDMDNLSSSIELCHNNGLSCIIQASNEEDVKAIYDLKHQPDAVITTDKIVTTKPPGIHIPLREATRPVEQVTEPTLFSHVEYLPKPKRTEEFRPLVKVCGIKTLEAAKVACESGADMIGMILVPGRQRTVDLPVAREISTYVRHLNRGVPVDELTKPQDIATMSISEANSHILRARARMRPLIVGVFRNQPLEEIIAIQRDLDLDIVQLHGSEPLAWCRMIPCPVIRRFTPDTPEFETSSIPGYHYTCLLDSEKGGEGKVVDWSSIKDQVRLGARFILAGGLTVDNVVEALKTPGVYGVDVSGGVERDGVKDLGLVEQFVRTAKSVKIYT